MTTSPSIARCSAPQSVVMAAPYRRRPTDTLWPTLRLVSRCVGVNWRAQGGDLRQRLLRPLRWLDTLPFGGHAREVTLERPRAISPSVPSPNFHACRRSPPSPIGSSSRTFGPAVHPSREIDTSSTTLLLAHLRTSPVLLQTLIVRPGTVAPPEPPRASCHSSTGHEHQRPPHWCSTTSPVTARFCPNDPAAR